MADTMHPDLHHMLEAALAAVPVIMEIYRSDFDVSLKGDASPVTQADEAAEAVILERLSQSHAATPVVAEEAASRGDVPAETPSFFLVDPLDGTKEFVSRNGEFTINIGLIENGDVLRGVVIAPALGRLWVGDAESQTAWRTTLELGADGAPNPGAFEPMSVRHAPERLIATGSRSHASPEAERLDAALGIETLIPRGSSLKFCTLAEGEADIYIRRGRTMEWDTAAGHAVLRAAGGRVLALGSGGPERELGYGKREQTHDADFANPHFVAYGDFALVERLSGKIPGTA